MSFTVGDREVRVHTIKEGSHEVALIYIFDPKVKATVGPAIELSLETFAVGPKAKRLYTGGSEEEPEAGPAVPL
jgi:hypothetical protein